MNTREPEFTAQTVTSSKQGSTTAGRFLLQTGRQVILYLPPLVVLLLPLLALLPDQGHEVIETVVTGSQWAYIALVLTPLSLTALLHSVQMLRRSAHLRNASAIPVSIESGAQFLLTLFISTLGLTVLAAPLYLFKFADSECIKGLRGFSGADECRPGASLLFLSAYCLLLILIPFLLHARGRSIGKKGNGILHKVWRCAPAISQFLLVIIFASVIARDTSTASEYGPVVAGALVSLFLVRLPRSSVTVDVKTSYWRKVKACVGDGWPTVLLACCTLIAFATLPIEIGQKLGSLFVLYAGVLCWLVVVSLMWALFFMLRDRLPIAGLCILTLICLTAVGTLYGSSDTVKALKVSATTTSGRASGTPLPHATKTPSIEEDFNAWSAHVDAKEAPRKVVIILAEGGGVRAAQWTSDMLFWLNAGDSDILRNTYAVVGVSGGALGATTYLARLAALYDYQLKHGSGSAIKGEPTAVAINGARAALTQDLMAPWVARYITTGAIQGILPGEVAASALLPGLWNAEVTCESAQLPAYLRPEFREICGRMPALINSPMRDFPKAVGEHSLPRLMYTATHVESGTRVIAASVGFTAADFPGAYDFNRVLGGDISLLDATYSSARFPGISRPGTLVDSEGHSRGHVVDGGYLDGSGALTAADVIDAIGRATHGNFVPIVIDLDNSPDDDKSAQDSPEEASEASASINPTYGMFQGIKHANGVRDLAAIAALRRQVCSLDGGLLTLGVPRDARPLALGWTLSQQASNRLDSAAYKVARRLNSQAVGAPPKQSLENAFAQARALCEQAQKRSSPSGRTR